MPVSFCISIHFMIFIFFLDWKNCLHPCSPWQLKNLAADSRQEKHKGKKKRKKKAWKYPLILKLVLFSQQHTMQLKEKESYLPIFQLESPSMGGVQKECGCLHVTLEYVKGRWHLFSKHILTTEGGWVIDNDMLVDVYVEEKTFIYTGWKSQQFCSKSFPSVPELVQ